jgi:hypothetical protein
MTTLDGDPEAAIRNHLIGLTGVTAEFGQRIYCGRNLPPSYEPKQGAAVLVAIRGGGLDYTSKVWEPSVQCRIYAQTEALARKAGRALFRALNETKSRLVIYARLEAGTIPTLLTEPGSNWPYMLAFYKIYVQNET